MEEEGVWWARSAWRKRESSTLVGEIGVEESRVEPGGRGKRIRVRPAWRSQEWRKKEEE